MVAQTVSLRVSPDPILALSSEAAVVTKMAKLKSREAAGTPWDAAIDLPGPEPTRSITASSRRTPDNFTGRTRRFNRAEGLFLQLP